MTAQIVDHYTRKPATPSQIAWDTDYYNADNRARLALIHTNDSLTDAKQRIADTKTNATSHWHDLTTHKDITNEDLGRHNHPRSTRPSTSLDSPIAHPRGTASGTTHRPSGTLGRGQRATTSPPAPRITLKKWRGSWVVITPDYIAPFNTHPAAIIAATWLAQGRTIHGLQTEPIPAALARMS